MGSMAKRFNTPTSDALAERASQQVFSLPIGHMRLLAQGHHADFIRACLEGNNDIRGAFLVFLATARNGKLANMAEDAGLPQRLKGGVSEQVYLYLWTHMHEDFMWLAQRSEGWEKAFAASNMPWKTVLSERFHKHEWDGSLASLLAHWEPKRLSKYPHALKYMRSPSELHVLAAACGSKEGNYMKAAQIDAIRPGASEWFKVRKALGLGETHEQQTYAFRAWWKQGTVQGLEALDADLFASGEDVDGSSKVQSP